MKQVRETVKEETGLNCFIHCGMPSTDTEPTEHPFADLHEDEAQLEDVVKQLQPDDCMTVSKYAETKNEVAKFL